MILILVTFIVIIGCVGIYKYNKIIRYKNKIKESLSLIDIHLKLRFDLIPNLVKVVKEYSKHENEVFDKLIKVRKQAMEATEEKEKLN